MTLWQYLFKVDEFWTEGQNSVCSRCEFFDEEEGGQDCGILHWRAIPEGNCLGLLERDGLKQPEDKP